MKRIPFDLNRAKQGAKIVDENGDYYDLIAHVPTARSCERVITMNRATGRIFLDDENPKPLSIEVEEEVIWVNMFKNEFGNRYLGYVIYKTDKDAKYAVRKLSNYVGTYPITL